MRCTEQCTMYIYIHCTVNIYFYNPLPMSESPIFPIGGLVPIAGKVTPSGCMNTVQIVSTGAILLARISQITWLMARSLFHIRGPRYEDTVTEEQECSAKPSQKNCNIFSLQQEVLLCQCFPPFANSFTFYFSILPPLPKKLLGKLT